MADVRIIMNSGAEDVLREAAVAELKGRLRGRLLRAGDDGYDAARKIWNGMIDKRPALIARCAGAGDVITCVNFARDHDVVLAVRGGGHNVAGNAACDAGLMIDLSGMKSVHVNPGRRTARAEAGVTWGEFDHETQVFGLATTGGQVSTTGVAGLTLGGGWGWLARKYGLASDNLMSVDIVTADGQLRTASDSENADLFWGVRGGGGNFGVVTSFEYRLHPVGPVVGGFVFYPFAIAREVLQRYRELTHTAPDELAVDAALLTLPDGAKVAGIAACYCGPVAEGECLLAPLKKLGTPVVDQLGPTSYTAVQTMLDASYPSGMQHYWKSSFLHDVGDNAIDTMIAHCTALASPLCHALLEYQLGGAVGRIDRDTTAFAARDAQHAFVALGLCTDPAEAKRCTQWARDFWEAMQPFSTGGVYVNYLGREGDEGAERVRAAYGADKYQRLLALKEKYDPTNLFRLNQNIKPTVVARQWQ
ncbi:MAG TPA: FAD-binding oxidoreductase [Methylomirabilota bacterium]|nr:FAD-binding oxidoreductase [Methylomirabilota bacterium]